MLDALHRSVLSTRDAAVKIGNELDDQSNLLGKLNTNVGAVTDEAHSQTKSVAQLLDMSANRGFYSTVIVLVIIILVLLLV